MKVRIASAGTGKTYALTSSFVAALAQHAPWRMAAVTFTRAAAAELKTRLRERLLLIADGEFAPSGPADTPPAEVVAAAAELAQQVLGATISTIHGFFAELLRQNALSMGLEPDFLRIDAAESADIFAEEARAYVFLHDEDPALAEELLQLFERRSLASELKPRGERAELLYQHFSQVMERYHRRLAGQALGPSDIELLAWKLVSRAEKESSLAERLRSRLQVVFVDEYQDTSPLQGEVFAGLERLGIAIEVVGDPKQSIYAFRNADVGVFRRAMRRGDLQQPLTVSWRHDKALVEFLNRYCGWVAKERPRAFDREEAPTVQAGPRAGEGRVIAQLLHGNASPENLRPYEADQLARWLQDQHQDYSWREMAVLLRSHNSAPPLQRALDARQVPYVIIGGRGFYDLIEVRDLVHAARLALDPNFRYSLAAFLRGPFGALSLDELELVLAASDPLAELARLQPQVYQRIEQLSEWVQTLRPLDFFEKLVRAPLLAGRSYLESLEPAARANVDQLLFKMAQRRYGRLEFLLRDLEDLRGSDEAEVPEGGFDAVRIYTVHGSKGLEWPVVALYDLNRVSPDRALSFYVRPGSGEFACEGDPSYQDFKEEWKQREEFEHYRLLYVALSRAAKRLLISMSVRLKTDRNGQSVPSFWRRSLGSSLYQEMSLPDWPGVEVRKLAVEKLPQPLQKPRRRRRERQAGEELLRAVPPLARPPVYSPSAFKAEKGWSGEQDEGEEVTVELEDAALDYGLLARTGGILVHYAIAENWGEERLADLWSQEAAQRLTDEEARLLKADVTLLLRNYWKMLGKELAEPSRRDEDLAEYPLLLPTRSLGLNTVWEGVIDRLYRLGERWILEDYKTDREVHPERYHFQLGLYRQAIKEAWGIEPQAQLVFLRFGKVVRLEAELLQEAFERGIREIQQV